ncbi:chalcone isomerase family protein [Aquabacterium sp.]|uniref:chalcone isomerase family protein n=1 Tax=Aquabacterium sp. TaxID=1872578 RepID=UPI0035ADEA5C
MKRLKTFVLSLGLIAAAVSSSSALAAKEIAGVKFDDRYAVAGQSLQLNGAGLRKKMFIKVYAIGLYLNGKASTPSGVLSQPGAKSVRIVMLRDVSAQDLSDSLIKSITANVSSSEMPSIQSRLNELEANLKTLGQVKRGDVIQMDFLPASGTHITSGAQVMPRDIPGEDFYRALLKIWIGEKPSDGDLKDDLLGKAS